MSQLEQLYRFKASLLKRALGRNISARNRLAFRVADFPLLTEDLLRRLNLLQIAAFEEKLRRWEQKFAEIDPD